ECSLNDIVAKAIASVSGAADRTVVEAREEFTVLAAPEELSRVFVNLIDNALKHSDSTGPVFIGLEKQGDMVFATIQDQGKGIGPEHLPHVFERFYRSDESRASDTGGSGLGLAICEQLVKANGGTISVS